MRGYIHKCHTISVLDSYNSGILSQLNIRGSKTLIEPDYKEFIPSAYLRRMSKVIRMGAGTALRVMENESVEGIIIGTGVGCYDNSTQFSKEYLNRPEGSLSPTAFIQSTDNTIAGQIAIILKNNSYNITYIHKGIAFENALMDALLLSEEINGKILVGGVDEWIASFELGTKTQSKHPEYWLGEGASFFILNQLKKNSLAKVLGCKTVIANKNNLAKKINSFLDENNLELPNLVLTGNSFINNQPILEIFPGIKTLNYSNLSGIYFTNSAFATQLAVEIISQPELAKEKNLYADKIMVINNFNDTDFGFIYLSKP